MYGVRNARIGFAIMRATAEGQLPLEVGAALSQKIFVTGRGCDRRRPQEIPVKIRFTGNRIAEMQPIEKD